MSCWLLIMALWARYAGQSLLVSGHAFGFQGNVKEVVKAQHRLQQDEHEQSHYVFKHGSFFVDGQK